ncbi:hypothetical protein [Kamptonema sp. UHCC 0994]|uniref:hypothetical protein n=1 Tax=Kamptonema sp. UHCC 0994 TaxID=3031329 RepID=UPI0023B89393|nr:hypothetical protein [Kamptonema sp. UHCC 0994]MDF0552675.1 hypothetical protein [Kamptonema sp. UHCC 0994]
MNLFIARNPLHSFDYQMPKVKVATLQKLAPKQELNFANFSQHPGWCQVSNCYLANYNKALALMDYLHFFEIINSLKLIYKNSVILEKKAFVGLDYSRPPPLAKTAMNSMFTAVFAII